MAETKSFTHDLESSRALLEELIHSSYQKDYVDIRRAALISLIFVMRVQGIEVNLQQLSPQAENELLQLRFESEELAFLLDVLLKRSDSVDNVV